jgi:DNA processing protein
MDIPLQVISDEERLSRLRLLRSEGIGPVTFHALIGRFGSATSVIGRWSSIARRLRRTTPPALSPLEGAQRELERIRNCGASLIAHDEPGYPAALAATDAPPPLITARGNLSLFQRECVAVVGSRNASAIGIRFARETSRDLGAMEWVVVSGLARGIDTAAHKGSLETGTIAVLAGGIDIVYPPENAKLHAEIGERGLLVSEVQFGQQPTAQHFPRRNRIISGLARGVLVVEATLNSGSLITARFAGEQGRDVFAVPGSPLDPRARGTNALLRQGAILTENADDISSILQPSIAPRGAMKRCQPPASFLPGKGDGASHLQAEILDRLSQTPIDLDELIRVIGASPADVSAALMDLEFAGLLTRHPGQRVSLGSER